CDRCTRANHRGLAPRGCRSHALEPKLGARPVHEFRGDLLNSALARIVAVDLLHHPAHKPGHLREASLGVGRPHRAWSADRGARSVFDKRVVAPGDGATSELERLLIKRAATDLDA